MTDAHDQRLTLHILCHIPAHEPRESDPHYKLFHQAKERLRKQGLLNCAIDGCTYPGPMELHHEKIEYSLSGGVDITKFNKLYGLHLDDAEFADFIEGPGNLEVLCPCHHRTHMGVHCLPEPLWNAIRVWRADLAPAAETEPKET
jgi:hypothetical protein